MSRLGLLATIVIGLPGCIVVTDHTPHDYFYDGTLTVDWTIDGRKNPSECRQSDAETLQVIVTTTSGTSFGDYETDCEDFDISIDLPPGRYLVSAVLLDHNGDDRTTLVDLDPVRIYEDDSIIVDIDFPASSFF